MVTRTQREGRSYQGEINAKAIADSRQRFCLLKLLAFDERLFHREIVPYQQAYAEVFSAVEILILARIPEISLEHIGSTAVPDLRGKPMIDVFAYSDNRSLELRGLQGEFEKIGFHRRNVWTDRDDKPYVCASVDWLGSRYNLNVHICYEASEVLLEARAFKDILLVNSGARRAYEAAKDRAHAKDPENPEIYNREKESTINEILGKLNPQVR